MNVKQFLLLKLAEECAEVAQRASKQIQFGKLEIQHDQPLTNGERLKNELLDLNVITNLLQERLEIPTWTKKEFKQAKKQKLEKLQKYLNLSYSLNQLPKITL